jgi:hypothetical protein
MALPNSPVEFSGLDRALRAVMAYSRQHDYAGYSKFDALNSTWVEKLLGSSYWGRLLITQAVNRSYLHLRPLLGVQKSRNPKGIANFIKAYANLFKMGGQEPDIVQAQKLAEWLLRNHSNKDGQWSGLCWGYNFPWQSPGFFAPRHSPNCIVTVFCAEALLGLHQAGGEAKYLRAARSAADFVLGDLPVLEEDHRIKCIGYVPRGLRWKVININAVTAGFLSRLALACHEPELMAQAQKMVRWVLGEQTDYGAWYYTVPAKASGIGHDNYHTGGILDGILDYMLCSGDQGPGQAFVHGLEFYRQRLFQPDGAPRLTDKKRYPYDIHGAAQGIISFSRSAVVDHANLDFARHLAAWALANMRGPDGRFYYRRHRFFTRRECLMRWNNSWMSWALSELLLALTGGAGERR